MSIQFEPYFENPFDCFSISTVSNRINIEDQLNNILGIHPIDIGNQDSSPVSFLKRKSSLSDLSTQYIKSEIQSIVEKQPQMVSTNNASKYKSNHHNFQKHTFTAIKDIIQVEEFKNCIQEDQFLKATEKLWKQFMKLKGKAVMTKRFLSVLFKIEHETVEKLKDYGFEELFQQFNEEEIYKAKIELSKIAIKLLTNKSIESHVEKRQITRKEQFRLYLINFRQDLENTKMKKRISKNSSEWIKDNAKIFDCLN